MVGSADVLWNEELQELVMLVRSQHRQELLSCAQLLEQSLGEAVKSPFLEIFKAWLDEVMNNLMEFLLMEGVPAHGRMISFQHSPFCDSMNLEDSMSLEALFGSELVPLEPTQPHGLKPDFPPQDSIFFSFWEGSAGISVLSWKEQSTNCR